MSTTFAGVEREVINTLSERTLKDFWNYVKKCNPPLWGTARPKNFLYTTVILAIFHDLTGLGYQKILDQVSLSFHINKRSLEHNTKVIRRTLGEWGRSKTKLFRKSRWDRTAAHVHQSTHLPVVNIWIDSTDFKLARTKERTKKSDDWSFKENAPAQRFMCLADGETRILAFEGGYSPKIYDGHFIEFKRPIWEQDLAGATIIGDNHFRSGSTRYRNVTWVTPYPRPSSKGKKDGELSRANIVGELTKVQQKWNSEIAKIRARVEQPFGLIKKKWALLRQPWRESKNQQEHLIAFAVGVHNFSL